MYLTKVKFYQIYSYRKGRQPYSWLARLEKTYQPARGGAFAARARHVPPPACLVMVICNRTLIVMSIGVVRHI